MPSNERSQSKKRKDLAASAKRLNLQPFSFEKKAKKAKVSCLSSSASFSGHDQNELQQKDSPKDAERRNEMDGVKKGNERDDVVNAEKLTETVSMDEINETDGTLNKNLDGYDISCVSDESTPLGVEVVDDDAEEESGKSDEVVNSDARIG